MKQLDAVFGRFATDRDGATSIEYSLIATGVALAIVAVVQLSGTQLNTLFNAIVTGFQSLGA